MEKIKEIKNEHEKAWLRLKGVVAVGIGETHIGQTGIIVTVIDDPVNFIGKIPREIDGVIIQLTQSDEIKAL